MTNNVNTCTVDVKVFFFTHLVVMQTVMILRFLISTAVNQGSNTLRTGKYVRDGDGSSWWTLIIAPDWEAWWGGLPVFSFTCRYIVCSH